MPNRIQWDSHHGPAINVKDQSRYDHDLPEAEAERIWEDVCERFWEDASEIAQQKFDYAGVYGEGRSGGWLVPHYSQGSNLRAWTDSLGSDEPEYQTETAKFERFGEAILELFASSQVELRDELAEAQREAQDTAALLDRGTPGRGF